MLLRWAARTVGVALTCGATSLAAQAAATSSWTISAPDAALAWFTVLADWRVDGDGAFSYINAVTGEPAPTERDEALVRRLRSDQSRSVLHFAPLYYPSANRASLAGALRAAAGGATPPEPRANFLMSALGRAMPATARRDYLPALASALERATPVPPSAAQLAGWQRRLDSLYLPALAPYLTRERLDAGRLSVAPALGAEGRLFAATPDRTDNLVAVGTFVGDPDPDAPLFAFVREICFPSVSRAATAARLDASSVGAPRRSSVAAVRCGAALMQSCLPSRVAAYQAFWIRQAERNGLVQRRAAVATDPSTLRIEFDRAFPAETALAVRVNCARSVPASPAASL
jgi:hypothetical protein